MRVVFLDFDGVLNSYRHLSTLPRGAAISPERMEELGLDPACVERLNEVCEAGGAGVVVTSSWKDGRTPRRIEEMLRAQGFSGAFYGCAPTIGGGHGWEAAAWLDANPGVESFVLLDDERDMGALEPFHVTTLMHVGMLDEHVDEAIRVLAGLDRGPGGEGERP